MSDAIKQLHASYSSLEDRILFTVDTRNNQQMQAWITRRFLKLLFPILQGQHPVTGNRLVAKAKQNKPDEIDDNKPAFTETAGKNPANSKQQFERPIGDNPITLAKITFKNFETENPQLLLEPEQGSGFAFGYEAEILKTLLQLFSKAMANSNWEFEHEFITQMPEQAVLQ